MKFVGLKLLLVLLTRIQTQQDPFKKYKIDTFINVNAINDIEVTNSDTHKSWHIKQPSLEKVKSILKQSTVMKGLHLKPGHLYMDITFKTKNVIRKESYYMYNTSIFYDDNQPLSIELRKEINWDNLK